MALGNPVVDYLSLDIQRAEYKVLKTIPFKQLKIKLFGIEVAHAGKIFNGSAHDITKLLAGNGYQYVGKSLRDRFYRKKTRGESNIAGIVTVS